MVRAVPVSTNDSGGQLYPGRYLRVRYEDLVQGPSQVIEQILNRVSLKALVQGPSQVIEQILNRVSLKAPLSLDSIKTRDNHHQPYGNAIALKRLTELKEHVAWKTAMAGALPFASGG